MTRKLISGAFVALATFGMIVPQQVMAAAPTAPAKASVPNVRLTDAGQLVGQTVDASGAALKGANVELRKNGLVAATATTNVEGQFAMNAVTPGVYQLAVGTRVANVRVWTGETAPPSAKPQALLLAGEPVVRGQYCQAGCPPGDCNCGGGGYFGGLDFITLTTVGASVTGAVLAGVALSEINDVQDELAASP